MSLLTVNEKIRLIREQCGMSQEELARRVGYSDRSSIAKVESGKVAVTVDKIYKYADALGVGTLDLLDLDDDDSIILRQSPDAMLDSLLAYLKDCNLLLVPNNLRRDDDIADFVADIQRLLSQGEQEDETPANRPEDVVAVSPPVRYTWSVRDSMEGIQYQLDDDIVQEGVDILFNTARKMFSKNPDPHFAILLKMLLRLDSEAMRYLTLQVKGILNQ